MLLNDFVFPQITVSGDLNGSDNTLCQPPFLNFEHFQVRRFFSMFFVCLSKLPHSGTPKKLTNDSKRDLIDLKDIIDSGNVTQSDETTEEFQLDNYTPVNSDYGDRSNSEASKKQDVAETSTTLTDNDPKLVDNEQYLDTDEESNTTESIADGSQANASESDNVWKGEEGHSNITVNEEDSTSGEKEGL